MSAMENVTDAKKCLTLGAFQWRPHIIILGGEPNNLNVGGIMPVILDIFAEKLNFCYKIILPKDRTSGALLPNGTWTGVMGLLTQGKIDFTALGIGINQDRLAAMDRTEALFHDEWSVGYVRPNLESDIIGFVMPFSVEVWIGVFLSSIAAIMITSWVRLVEGRNLSQSSNDSGRAKDPEEDTKALSTSIYEATLWIVAPLLSQSVSVNPRGDIFRFLCVMWLLVNLILGNVYRGNLKAKLILPKITIPFDTLEELVDSKLPIWLPIHSRFHEFLKASPEDSIGGDLIKQLVELDRTINIDWALRSFINGDFALSLPRSAIVQMLHDTFSRSGRCANYIMNDGLLQQGMEISLPIGSHWKPKLDKLIVPLKEAGILDYIFNKGVANATECLKPISYTGSDVLRPMELADFYGVFAIYTGGIVLALFSFVMEVCLSSKG